MRNRLISFLENAALKKASSGKGFICPRCGIGTQARGVVSGQVLTCQSCGYFGSALEWVMKPDSPPSARPEDIPTSPPPGTRITLEPKMGGMVWKIPASGKSGGLLLVGWIWTLLCLTMGVIVLWLGITGTGSINDQPATVERALGMELMMIPFHLIGIVMLYFGYRTKFASHQLAVGRGRIALTRRWLGRAKEKSMVISEVQTIQQVEFYSKNYQPVHGIEIKGARKKLRFGSSLTEAEKAWLVAQFQRSVWPDRFKKEEAKSPGLVVTEEPAVVGSQPFSILIPKSSGALGIGIMLLVMGLLFLGVGLFVIRPHGMGHAHSSEGFFRILDLMFGLLDSGFQVIWCLISTIMLVAGIACLRSHQRNVGVEQRLVGSPNSISLKRFRHGTVIEEKTFERRLFRDIRATVSGSANGKSMKRIEMILGDRSETIANWVAGEKADALVEEVRQAMR